MVFSCRSERHTHITVHSLAALFVSVLLLAGCLSPLDPDTPRLRTVSDLPTSDTVRTPQWLPAVMIVSATESGMPWPHRVNFSSAEVDTSEGKTAIRFRYSGTLNPPYNTLFKFLLSFTIADSIGAGVSVSLDSDPGSGRGASFETAKSIDSTTALPLETIVIYGPADGNTALLLQRETGKNSVSGTFIAGIARYRMNLEADIRITW